MTYPSLRLGDATIACIPETTLVFEPVALLPDWEATEEDGQSDGKLTLGVHSWLVRTPSQVVLIDPAIGNGKRRASPLFDRLDTPFLDRLAAAGATPEAVTHVLVTHVHTDHVGWNTRRVGETWVPTFPNARYFLPRAGCAPYLGADGPSLRGFDVFTDSVLPVIEAGQAAMVEPEGGEVLDGFTVLATPGHSRDHQSILLESCGERALAAGDILHHPVQLRRPDWSSAFCASPEDARRTRHRMLDRASAEELLFLSSHFPAAPAGRVIRDGGAFRWRAASVEARG
ncbi:MBL fold metallo-hydrolase [Methylobacterium sp. JK268]